MYFTQKYCVDLDIMCICHVYLSRVLHHSLHTLCRQPKCQGLSSVCVCSLMELLVPICFYFRFITLTCQIYGDFFLFIEVFPIDFSLYLMLFLKTSKACVMTQGSHFSLDSSLPRKVCLAQEKASSSRFPNSILSLGEHSKLPGS